MLDFTCHRDKPFLPLLIRHDDPDREFDYITGAEQALKRADANSWTVVSVKDDWTSVFPAAATNRGDNGSPVADDAPATARA
jgi:hypothetical protein